MDIAIGALVLTLLLLPGAAILNSYYTSFLIPDRDEKIALQDLLFRGLLFSLAAHLISICILSSAGKHIDFNMLYQVTIGEKEKLNNKEFGPELKGFLCYTMVLTISCMLISKGFKTIVIKYNLDQRYHGLRTANYWFSFFSNPSGDLLWADVLIKGNVLYSGIVSRFEYSSSKDEIELLVLKQTFRTPFLALLEIEGVSEIPIPAIQRKVKPTPINGEDFLIRGSEIVNINLYPITIEDEPRREAENKPDSPPTRKSKKRTPKVGI